MRRKLNFLFHIPKNIIQVGACIVNLDKRIVGMGYNGMPDGCPDTDFPWTKGDTAETDKHLYGMHTLSNDIRYLDSYNQYRQ